MLEDFHKDTVTIFKKNGEKHENVKASVQSKKIFIEGIDILIETDDLIQRKMTNGGTENYRVIDPGFHEGDSLIKAGYQITHKNLGLPEAEKSAQNITYNFSGHNSRVNNGSVDNSTNVVQADSTVTEHIKALRQEVNRVVESESEKKETLEIVDAIEGQFKSESPSKAVLNSLCSALPQAGSIATIGSFLISALGS